MPKDLHFPACGCQKDKELYAAREAGMHPVQCTWFRHMAYEPHIPCRILPEFDRADSQREILEYVENK